MEEANLNRQVAVITGGASGIGRATAKILARQGARVLVGDHNCSTENESAFQELGIAQVECDVRRESDLRELIDRADAINGSVSILVNCAGINMAGQIPDITEDQWDACLDTNLKGAFFASKYAIRSMCRGGGGAIVNISSNAGVTPRADDPVYCISKAALIALTRSLALCHGRDKIRVNAVCPGPVGDTGMMEDALNSSSNREDVWSRLVDASPMARALDRMITPDEIAQSVLYLVSDAAVMVTGTVVGIDGGKSLGRARR